MTTATKVSLKREKAQNGLDRAFGAKDWDAYYRALDRLLRVVHEEAGGDPEEYIPILKEEEPDAIKQPKAQYPACGRCKGAGECNVEDRKSAGGEPIYKVDTCPSCKGSGEDRTKKKVLPSEKPASPPVEETPEWAVMQLTLEGFPLGWPEVWGVIHREGNPRSGDAWLGIFPNKEAASAYRDTLAPTE